MRKTEILSQEETLQALDCCLSVTRHCDICPQKEVCGPYVKSGITNIRESVRYWIGQTKHEKMLADRLPERRLQTNEIMISIRPQWCELIRSGQKTDEIRRTKPKLTSYPARVYIYQTENGGVIGEFELRRFTYIQAWKNADGEKHLGNTYGLRHCIDDNQLFDYLYKETSSKRSGGWAWHIENLKIYDKPKALEKFGMKRPPQSWCYIQ